MMIRVLSTLPLLALVVATLVACSGGGDSAATPTSPAPTTTGTPRATSTASAPTATSAAGTATPSPTGEASPTSPALTPTTSTTSPTATKPPATTAPPTATSIPPTATPTRPPAPSSVTINLQDDPPRFIPAAAEVAVGGTVTWNWTGTEYHDVVSNSGAFASELSNEPGHTYSRTFNAAGSYPYHCSVHPQMIGTITVR